MRNFFSITERFPIVIVTSGRHEMLTATLASLAAAAPELSVYVVYHGVSPRDVPKEMRYVRNQLAEVFSLNKGFLYLRWEKSEKSLAQIRAEMLEELYTDEGHQYVLMTDDDVIVSRSTLHTFSNVVGAAKLHEGKPIGVVGGVQFDVTNEREYKDWSRKVYSSKEGFDKDCDDWVRANYHLWSTVQLYDQSYSTTHGIWNVKALIDSGVLEYWKNYPKGVRCYDFYGSQKLSEAGYEVIFSTGTTFWHLHTKNDRDHWKEDPEGSYDVKD